MSSIRNTVNPLLANHLKRAASKASSVSNGAKHRVLQSDRLESSMFQDWTAKEVSGLILDGSGTVADKYVISNRWLWAF